jgi:hypothetical protein
MRHEEWNRQHCRAQTPGAVALVVPPDQVVEFGLGAWESDAGLAVLRNA